MSKLDAIQERIQLIERHEVQSICETEILEVLSHIVSELKRIDAEQKSLDKVVTDLSNIHP